MTGWLFDEAAGGVTSAPPLRVSVVVRDRGPEPDWHRDRRLYGAWLRFEAEFEDYSALRELGSSPWEAVNRLVGAHRALLERRWSA
jgi:hypothetical protein